MEINFSGKRALVTGASQGIGLAVVKKLLFCGATVVALDVKEEQLSQLAKDFAGVETIVVNLSNWEATLEALKGIGRVQLVVNNAGVHYLEQIQDLTEECIDKLLQVNVKAVMAVCKHVVNDLTSSKQGGAIVNIASVMATRPDVSKPAYQVSKAGVLQFTRCLALECAPLGIRVNAVSPGLVRTSMGKDILENPEKFSVYEKTVPMKNNVCEPEDIANAVAFLLSDELAGKITGVNLTVDAGFMLT